MYTEYLNAYKHYSSIYGADTAVFYQVGKFYEFYDSVVPESGETHTSMRRFTDILGVRVTIRKGDGPDKTDGLFAGVPEQSLHKYATLLTRSGWVVIVYEQVKDAKGAVKSRDVTRILTPGTHVEAATDSAVWIAGLWIQAPLWGSQAPLTFAVMVLDLTTGKSLTYEGRTSGKSSSWTADDIFHFFQVYFPKECVVWWRGAEFDQPSVEFLQRQFGLPGIRIQILSGNSGAQGGFEIPTVREEFLQRTLSVNYLLSLRQALNIDSTPQTERLLCCLLQRVKEQYPSGFNRLPLPERWIPGNHLSLGNQALVQLNMVSPQVEQSVLGIFQKTHTVFGKRAMRNRILYPKAAPEELEQRYEEIQTIMEMNLETANNLRTNLRQIEDLPRLHRRISEGEITSSEILLLDKSYICSKRLASLLKDTPISKQGWSFKTIFKAIESVFSTEKARTASEDSFCLVDEAAPEVTRVEKELRGLFEKLQECAKKLQVWANVPPDSLRLEFREILGPTIAASKATMTALAQAIQTKEDVPYNGIRIQQKKASSHLEIPFLETTFQQIIRKRLELQTEIRRILPTLCSEISEKCLTTWNSLEEWVALVDVTNTIATVSMERGFVRPVCEDAPTSFLAIEGLRHPLIEATHTRVEYVKHNVNLSDETSRGWLVYGMNASGKSSLMKAVGIALILAQAGSYVPASSFRFRPFKNLFTRILNTDNLWAGLSSFAVEMTELREILQNAKDDSLVLGDEVCSGTESVSATAIVGASLTHLHSRGAKFIFATHLHGLLEIPSLKTLSHLSVWHLKVRYDPAADRLIYERTLTSGPGDSLYGLEVARAMNLPDEVLTLAHTLRRGLLGTKTEMDAPGSSWNSGIQRRVCEVCGEAAVKTLEVHHIRQRSEANEYGVFDDGTHQDHPRNLIVVCETCHDKSHAQQIHISPMIQTSDGPIRTPTTGGSVISETRRRSKWTDEQIQVIQEYLRKHPRVPPKRAIFDLGEKGIVISVTSLRSLRENF